MSGTKLKCLGVTDNPFDTILYEGLEYLRGIVWFNTRYIAGQTLDDLNSSCNSIQSFRVSRIQDAIKTLSSLSEEDVELLRTKSIYILHAKEMI